MTPPPDGHAAVATPLQRAFDWVRQWSEPRSVAPESPEKALERRHRAIAERALRSRSITGNRAELLIDGPETHGAMFAAIAAASDHVNIESYIVEDDGPGHELAELLVRKANEGVRINLLYDSVGSWRTPSRYFDRLRAAGVRLVEFNPINPLRHPIAWTFHMRNHRKLLVVDGNVGFIGGVNISSVYSHAGADTNRQRWRDTHLRLRGPVVAELQKIFLDHWRSIARRPAQPAKYFPPLQTAGEQSMLVTGCHAGRRNPIYRALLDAINHAEKRVYVTAAYFVPTRRLMRSLVLAARRGVDVRLALPGFSDLWAPLAAGRSKYGRLLNAGVRIYERHDAMLHAKSTVIDGVWSCLGSSNFDWRSFLHNAESNVVIIDREFGLEMDEVFESDLAQSREITLESWVRRGVLARGREWIARKMEFLL